MDTVIHDGRETTYRRVGADGEGPTTLYVHGSGGTHRAWVNQYAPDGPAHPAVALDLSGHGESTESDTTPGETTLSAYAADIVAVAHETGAKVLVGHSLGGAVVFRVLLDTPFDPDAAVFAGTGARLAVHDDIQTLLQDEEFDRLIEQLHEQSRFFYDADKRTLEQSKATLRATGLRVTRRDFLTCHEFDVRNRLGEIEIPALAVVGEHDALTPPAYHEYLAAQLPSCELAVIESAAHLAMLEQPRAFSTALERFFERVFE